MAITWDDFITRLDKLTKKDVYVYVSLGLSLSLFACELNDLIHIAITEDTWKTTAKFTMALLLIHTIAFYSAILGYIYATQAKQNSHRMSNLALVSIAANVIAFILRITLEVACINFREEYYRLATESGK